FIFRACHEWPHPCIVLVHTRRIEIKNCSGCKPRPCVIDDTINLTLEGYAAAINIDNFVLIAGMRQ
ncbi:hypothetical protein ACV8S2_05180, partial [Citrobacter amalonaticus]